MRLVCFIGYRIDPFQREGFILRGKGGCRTLVPATRDLRPIGSAA